MRESPSGAANGNATKYLNGITIAGSGGSQSEEFLIPQAKVGDTVTVSFDSGAINPIIVGSSRVSSAGHVWVELYNFTGGPQTINNVNMYVEVFPRG